MQCTRRCGSGIFPAETGEVTIDLDTMRAANPLPACPKCGALARPNILMFGDWDWDPSLTQAQQERMDSWLGSLGDARLVVIEFGAGRAVPTVRMTSEQIVRQHRGTLIRVNPREPDVPRGQISVASNALAAIIALDQILESRNSR
jgi:NAD-dependent SIR2 family protein deacetylase